MNLDQKKKFIEKNEQLAFEIIEDKNKSIYDFIFKLEGTNYNKNNDYIYLFFDLYIIYNVISNYAN